MSLRPDITHLLGRARGDLAMGLPVALCGPSGGALIAAAETLDAARLAGLRSVASGAGAQLALAITARRAETLKARAYDGDLARIVLPPDAGTAWIAATADPQSDLASPMKGPFQTQRGDDATLHRLALRLVKAARLLPAALVLPLQDAEAVANAAGLTILPAEAADAAMRLSSPPHPVISARVPLQASHAGRVHVFRPDDGSEEHFAIEIGQPPRDAPVLTRLHSACFTGDVLGSLKCDCGPQLRAALAQMGAEGAGVLLYLNQEGRGIGLANKMRAYSLQDQGFDTVEANHRLGFEDDERDFRIGAGILAKMGFGAVRLMTNNPAKIDMMRRCGIDVAERVPLIVGQTAQNKDYLATKARKSGHLL
ncbi:GTP cyclohydrolase II [Pelagivirga sediminicola]|uniref:GTP cyclohydrolase-2 n=1 Tax=Pelagivirga sediminicola TaxID=2170575 RepID=A0A2T7G678_9RHOB|nr:GTP cyclohydrolase II [Pelagivirga sediminicola]PVA09935.1 GTP cyclohydrolase II [Pelagivirga sediminicola]